MDDNEDVRKKFTRIELFAQAQEYLKLKQSEQVLYNPNYYYQSANYYRNLTINIAWYADEIFIPINGFNNYLISNYGRTYSIYLNMLMTPTISDKGYCRVNLIDNNGLHFVKPVHRLIMLSFNYFPGCENYQVNHIDGNKRNNYFNPLSKNNNLEWCTDQQNTIHAIKNGLRNYKYLKGSNNPNSIFTENQVETICQTLENYPNINNRKLAQLTKNEYNQQFIKLITSIKTGSCWRQISEKYKNIFKISDRIPKETIDSMKKLVKLNKTNNEIILELNLTNNRSNNIRINLIRQNLV